MPEPHDRPGRTAGTEEDFASLFEQSLKTPLHGDVITGRVVSIGRDVVTIDIGYKCEGSISLHEFLDHDGACTVSLGDDIDVFFEGTDQESGAVHLSRQKALQLVVWRDVERAFQEQGTVEGTIVGKVKGGLKVDIGVAAFLPGSHADLRPTRNLDRYIGQRGRFAILKFNRSRGNVVVSRRAVLERERTALKSETLKVLEEGVILEGTVKNITDYGAFVDLGGIDGLLHVTDMSWGRVGHPSELVNVGDHVKVVVLKYDPERERVSLGMKQVEADPWDSIEERFRPGVKVQGKVRNLTDFGAFVELEPGIDGLLHISDMTWARNVAHPSELLKKGQPIETVILHVDKENKRISLGLKQLQRDPWEDVTRKFPVGSNVKGKVVRLTEFGAFVELEPGIDGLLHISQMSSRPVAAPQDVVQLGDELTVKVIRIEPNERRIGLSLRDLAADMPIVEEEEHRGRRGGRKGRDRDRYDSDDDD